MTDYLDSIIRDTESIRQAIAVIDASSVRMALAVDSNDRFVGTVTDGDVRRSILAGKSLDIPVSAIVNRQALVMLPHHSNQEILDKMRASLIKHIPVLDIEGRIVDIKGLPELVSNSGHSNAVVLMAGGQGKRLRPLTQDTPKPLLDVGGQPILLTILKSFRDSGFRQFYLSVNYMADQIINYFGDGSHLGVQIHYLHEDRPLGTAGALRQLQKQVNEPFFVMNGDILTNIPMEFVLNYHKQHGQMATMCVQSHSSQVPYGVVEFDDNQLLTGIREKPVFDYFVNAGIYVLQPEALDYLSGDYMDMPDLLQSLAGNDRGCAVCPIREYWMDIGKYPDYVKANEDFIRYFGGEQ